VRNATAGPGAAELVQTLADPDGRVVRSWQATLSLGAGERGQLARRVRVERPALWGPGRPSLYRLRTEVRVGGRLVDVVEERTGFRDFRLEGGRFLLNGQPIALRGVGKHQETEHRLSAVADEDLREDFARLVDLGVNSVRLAHYPHAPLAYDLADEAGLLVWAENGHSNPHRPGEEGEQITREMVRQNYNHPSIVMWSVGNESAFLRVNRLAAVVKQEDPGRLVTYASNTGTRGKKRHPDLDFIAQNTYRGWYRGEAWEFEERAVSMRFVSESGGGAVVSHHTDYADARHVVDAFEPEEYRQLLAEVHFQVVFRDRAAEVPLYLVWILRDFATDKYKGRNTKGLLTYANLEKDAYHLYRSFLRPEVPVVHLTSQTRFVRRGRADNGIKAYANRPVLELLVNGRSQGLRRNGEHRHGNGRVVENVFHWPATLAPGRNEVRVRDGAGHEDAAVVYQLEPGQTHSPSGPEALLTDLRSSNPRNPAVLVETPARDQWPFYAEFDGTADNSFDRLPLRVQGARWIATSRPSKPGLETELRFRVGRRPLEVFVMAAAGGPLPRAWARDGFQDTGEQGLFRDNDLKLVPVRLLARRAREGEVVRLAAAGRLDYVVLVKEGTGLEGRAAAEDTGRP
jgi:beta-galactosidase